MFGIWNMEHNLFGAFIFLKSFVNITFSPNLDASQDLTRKLVIDFFMRLFNLTL